MNSLWNKFKRNKIVLISAGKKLLVDVVLYNLATYIAVFARFDYSVKPGYLHIDDVYGILENIVFITLEIIFRIPLQLWEYSSTKEISDIFLVATLSKLFAYPIFYFSRSTIHWSRGAYLISYVLLIGFLTSARFFYRLYKERNRRNAQKHTSTKRILIVGAGDAGEKILREITSHPELNYEVVGFLDDDPTKRKTHIHGYSVLGDIASLPYYVNRENIDIVLIAIPSAQKSVLRRIVAFASETRAEIKTLPGIWEIVGGRINIENIKNVQLEDLLPRSEIKMDEKPVREYISGRTVLITGAGGSIGSEISRQVSRLNPKQILLLGRGENRIFYIEKELKEKYHFTNLVPIICDIRNREKVFKIFEKYKPDIVFHTAAHKHVPLMEKNPDEAVINNVFGTRNLLDAAVKSQVKKFINISTDKAVNPVNIMGASKRVIEIMLRYYAAKNTNTVFTSVRFGNVLGSAGSVVEVFKKQIKETGVITITDPRMERYFMLIPEAVQLVLQAGALGKGGEIFVLKMGEEVNIMEFAKLFIRLSGLELGKDVKIDIIGNRGGEKLSEELWSENEIVVPTKNPYILKIEENETTFDEKEFFAKIDKLKKFAEELDFDKIRKMFSEIVPESRLTN